jgi:hypothetical protein
MCHFLVLQLDSPTLFLFRLDHRPMSSSTSPSSSILIGPLTEDPLTFDRPATTNHSSPIYCLPYCYGKAIESSRAKVGEVSLG